MCVCDCQAAQKWKWSWPGHLWHTAQKDGCSGPREHAAAWQCDLPPAAGRPDKHDNMLALWSPVQHSKGQLGSFRWKHATVHHSTGWALIFSKWKYKNTKGDVVSSLGDCVVNKFRCRQILQYLTCAFVGFLPILPNTFEVSNDGGVQLLCKNKAHTDQIPSDQLFLIFFAG